MKKVVLMTDFSENARNAVKYAINLFGNSVEYILVNTYTVRSSSGSLGNLGRIVRKRTMEDLEKELQFINAAFPNHTDLNIVTLCKETEAVDLVKDLGERGEVDLVVMGTKGATGLSKIVFGSVTSSIIRNTKLPVLSVPEETTFKAMDKIVFAADLSMNRKKELTAPLKSIALNNQAEVLLLHIVEEDELSQEAGEAKMNEIGQTFDLDQVNTSFNSVKAKSTFEGIEKFCMDNNADLLTVIARHNTFLDKLFHKSVSQELAFSLKMPLLTLEDSF